MKADQLLAEEPNEDDIHKNDLDILENRNAQNRENQNVL
jgi:hypothetical protein